MSPEKKKYSLWPAVVIICLAVVAPISIGTIEVGIARNARAEVVAIQQLEAVAAAESAYRLANQTFSASLDDLKDLPQPDPAYRYNYRRLSPETYVLTAEPTQPGKHGKRSFYLDQSEAIRSEVLHPATANSPLLPTKEPGK